MGGWADGEEEKMGDGRRGGDRSSIPGPDDAGRGWDVGKSRPGLGVYTLELGHGACCYTYSQNPPPPATTTSPASI